MILFIESSLCKECHYLSYSIFIQKSSGNKIENIGNVLLKMFEGPPDSHWEINSSFHIQSGKRKKVVGNLKNWIKSVWSYLCWSFLEKKVHSPQYFVSNNVFSWTSWHTSGEKKACNENLWCFWERPREKIIFYSSISNIVSSSMQLVSRCLVLDVFNENNKRVLMSKRKFPEKTKMVSLKSPPKGITMFLQVCMVQIKKKQLGSCEGATKFYYWSWHAFSLLLNKSMFSSSMYSSK